ncbi:MAG: ABC transporter substrate-binding protein [Anaerolineae bacterium]|nr:ABC transporter substrate-binding protein [Anaerolineae bacterium]
MDVYMLDVFFPAIVAEHLVDLTPFIDQAFLDQYYPALIEANTVGGQLLALPWFAGAGMLYYRTDLLEKYGYDAPPATWAELTEMAQAIQDGERAEGNPDFWGFVWQGNAYEGLTCDALEWQKSFGGGVIINPDGVIEVNNPETIEAFDLAASWVGTITPEAVLSYQEEDARAVWHAGNAAFMRNWGYAYTLSQADDSAVAGNFSVVPLPGSEPGMGAATLGGWQLGVTKYSSNIDAAVAFVKWMVSDDQLKQYHFLRGEQPVMPALYQDAELVEALPYLADMGNILNFATARPAVAGAQYNDVSQLYYTAVHSILEGQADAATAMADLELTLADLGFELP